MKPIELTDKNYETVISKGVVLVDFWAEWCGPCRVLGPIIDQLAEELEGKVVVGKVNTDNNTEIATKAGIRSIPSVKIFKDGELVENYDGDRTKKNFIETLNKYL